MSDEEHALVLKGFLNRTLNLAWRCFYILQTMSTLLGIDGLNPPHIEARHVRLVKGIQLNNLSAGGCARRQRVLTEHI